ncbi:MAG: hypothetical protein K2Y27_12775 [Xanthobacteraceae bacterium]|nr:hypothetical protein [Xanthobacteraceae bacterium]
MALKPQIARVFAENFEVYGVRKVWRQMVCEGAGTTQLRTTPIVTIGSAQWMRWVYTLQLGWKMSGIPLIRGVSR